MSKKHRVCPAEMAGMLDNVIRRWFQAPRKILSPYITQGMTVLDIGCGRASIFKHIVKENYKVGLDIYPPYL